MTPIHIDSITIADNRIRRVFDERYLTDLARSIDEVGLIHPVTVRLNGERIELVAGEQRYRAMQRLVAAGKSIRPAADDVSPQPLLPGYIPTQRTSELSERELFQIELEENIVRRDISWQERTAAVAKLHQLRGTALAVEGKVQTIKATATEVLGHEPSGTEAKAVSTQLILARHLDNPLVAKAKDEKEAVNILRRELQKEFTNELAALNPADVVSSRHSLLFGDSRVILPNYNDNRFDVIITDPPYGIGAHKMEAQGGSDSGIKHEYEDSFEYAKEFIEQSIPLWTRVAKQQAHLYMFCHITFWGQWASMFEDYGWDVWPVPLIWDKQGTGNIIGNVDGPRRTYEAILYARKGGRPVQKVGADVLHHQPTRNKLHAAEKPVSLYIELLSFSCIPGQEVLDPCCGSGPIFPACNTLGLIATGIERVEHHCSTAKTRLNSTTELEADLFDDVPF